MKIIYENILLRFEINFGENRSKDKKCLPKNRSILDHIVPSLGFVKEEDEVYGMMGNLHKPYSVGDFLERVIFKIGFKLSF